MKKAMNVQASTAIAVVNAFAVTIGDKSSGKIPQALGIDRDREQELDNMVKDCLNKQSGDITDDFIEITSDCRSVNETIYVTFHYAVNIEHRRSQMRSSRNPLEALLSGDGSDNPLAALLRRMQDERRRPNRPSLGSIFPDMDDEG